MLWMKCETKNLFRFIHFRQSWRRAESLFDSACFIALYLISGLVPFDSRRDEFGEVISVMRHIDIQFVSGEKLLPEFIYFTYFFFCSVAQSNYDSLWCFCVVEDHVENCQSQLAHQPCCVFDEGKWKFNYVATFGATQEKRLANALPKYGEYLWFWGFFFGLKESNSGERNGWTITEWVQAAAFQRAMPSKDNALSSSSSFFAAWFCPSNRQVDVHFIDLMQMTTKYLQFIVIFHSLSCSKGLRRIHWKFHAKTKNQEDECPEWGIKVSFWKFIACEGRHVEFKRYAWRVVKEGAITQLLPTDSTITLRNLFNCRSHPKP